MEYILGKFNYFIYIILISIGLYAVIAKDNLIKKLMGLNILQTAVFLFYISIGVVTGGTVPIIQNGPNVVYSNPLPHVLMLTGIVVGVATSAVAYALIRRIYDAYGTVEETDLLEMMHKNDG